MPSDSSGWQRHERDQRRAWLGLSPAQRLAWLWQAKQFARVAMGRAHPSASKHTKPSQEPASIRDSEVRPEDRDEIRREISRRAQIAEAAGESLDPMRAEALFATGDVDIQMALAGNRVTSRSLLEAMSALRATPGARAIRTRAKATLRGR